MKSLFKHLKAIDQSQDRTCVTFPRLLTFLLLSSTIFTGTSFLLPISSAQAALTRRDWCGTVWSVENQNTLAWVNPVTGLTTTTFGPTTQITMPSGSMGTAVAALGIHKESGTIYAFDRTGATGTLYKYKFGVDSAWQAVSVSGLIGLSGIQTIAGASNNLNKMTVDGNILFIAESNGKAVYSIPLNSAGAVTGAATVNTYTYSGDPGAYLHASAVNDPVLYPVGTEFINGGDITTDEYGDVYNITYNVVVTGYPVVNGVRQQQTQTTKAYFYKQSGNTWVYQGETPATANFAGAAFYKGDLYVKSALQLKKLDLTRSGSGYTGWNNALTNIGAANGIGTGSADLAACGTPILNLTKTRQIYSDALLTNLVADQTKVATGQYIKYTITAQNVGDAWARSTQIIDNLPTGTVYQPNSATLNGSNLGLATYPSSFTVNSPGISAGIVRYTTDPDTATLSFAVQVTATSGSISNQATSSYVDNEGLPSDPSVCTTTPKVNCANDAPTVSVVAASFSVSGTLYEDTDGGNDLDTSEPKLPTGITVNLLDNSNNVIKTITTDANGAYTFTGVTNGSYKIQVDINDSSIPTDLTLGTPNDLPVTVSGSPVTGKDFGFDKPVQPPGSNISGILYEDSDGGDDLDTNEPKLPANITVKLLDSSNNVFKTTTTDANGTYTFTGVANGSYKIQVNTTDTDIPSGYTLGTPNDLSVTVSSSAITNKNFGFDKPGNPNVLLVKRITKVNNSSTTKNGDNLAGYINETTNPYDDNILDNPAPVGKPDTDKWVDADNDGKPDLIGGINGGNVRPGDEIEYTIYYLSAGDTTANNVVMCDRVPENATFIPTAFNSFPTKNTTGLPGGDRGIIWQNNGAVESLTNASDGDTAEYLSPGIDPTIKYPGIKCDGSNTNGVVVVKLGNVLNATAPGTPTNSYGFIRFRGRVK